MVADNGFENPTLGLYEMLASVAHDIRTPLSSLLGFLELLKEETDPVVRQRYLANMEVCGRTLRELVDDWLDFAKLDAGKMEFRPAFCDVAALARSVVRTFMSAEKGVSLRCICGGLPSLRLDEHRLSQVLFNLIGNAVKFTDRGSVTVRLAFRAAGDKTGTLRLTVRDTGVGISRRDLKRLASPYARARTDARGGTGLGLSICKRIVECAGGSLALDSVRGRGTTVTVVLPKIEAGHTVRPRRKNTVVAEEDFASLRVLVVDDFEMNRIVLSDTCKRLGVGKIAMVSSGQQALSQLARHGPFDLLLADVKMRGIDGRRLTGLLRANPATARLPIYLVTADAEAVGYAAAIGADGCLVKPVVRDRLRQVLSSVKRNKSHA